MYINGVMQLFSRMARYKSKGPIKPTVPQQATNYPEAAEKLLTSGFGKKYVFTLWGVLYPKIICMIFILTLRVLRPLKYFIFLPLASVVNLQAYGSMRSVNHQPVFNSNSYSYTISEEVSLGFSAGTVSATDADGDKLTYSIKSGNTNSTFAINSSNGVITVGKYLNHHYQNRYIMVVAVTDVAGLSSETSVNILVKAGSVLPAFKDIKWGQGTTQPFGTHELNGEVVNGKLYIFGGYNVQKRPNYVPTKRSFVFDPVKNKWDTIADLPHIPLGANFGGVTHAGVTTDGTDIYFVGGYVYNASGTAQTFGTKQVWRYNVKLNTYTALPSLPIDLAAGQLKFVKGKLHYMGGCTKARLDTNVHYALNLDSLSQGWKVLAPLLNGTNHPGSAVYEGKIYFIGGSHKQDAKSIKQKTVEVYDPNTNAWTEVAGMPVPRDLIASAVVVMGDRIIVCTGELSPLVRCKLISAYSPASNTWAELTPLPVNRASGVAAVLNNTLYYTGGNFSNLNYKGVPVNNQTTKIDSFTLINADNEQPLKTLVNGDIINLSTLPTAHLNVRANATANTSSVQFELSGPQNENLTDKQAPFSLCGDDGSGDYFACTPLLGKYTIKGTAFDASGSTGTATSKTISFTVTNNTTQGVTLSAVADAFVRDGIYANTNYGDSALNIKTSYTSKFNRNTYLKFSLAGVSNIGTATLRLYGSNMNDAAAISLSVYGVNGDSWTEKEIDFKNAPASLPSSLGSAAVNSTLKYYEFDVTDFVKTQFAGDKVVSLMVKDPEISDKLFVFNSREADKNTPQLVIGTGAQNKPANADSRLANKYALETPEMPVKTSDSILEAKVHPNPVHKTFTVEFAKGSMGTYDLQIADPVGRIYHLGKWQSKPGANNININLSKFSLKTGAYLLTIQNDKKQQQSIKIIIE